MGAVAREDFVFESYEPFAVIVHGLEPTFDRLHGFQDGLGNTKASVRSAESSFGDSECFLANGETFLRSVLKPVQILLDGQHRAIKIVPACGFLLTGVVVFGHVVRMP